MSRSQRLLCPGDLSNYVSLTEIISVSISGTHSSAREEFFVTDGSRQTALQDPYFSARSAGPRSW
jgi:hypothetical protein